MAGTYTKLVNHFVFSTFGRRGWLTEEIRQDLFAYMGGIIRDLRGAAIMINGVEDHVHILAHVRPTISVSEFMKQVKGGSSEFVHDRLHQRRFSWQEGYSAFSVRGNDYADLIHYIERQGEHHKKEQYQPELRRMLEEAGIKYYEKYLWT